jgi:hypothetical protein
MSLLVVAMLVLRLCGRPTSLVDFLSDHELDLADYLRRAVSLLAVVDAQEA